MQCRSINKHVFTMSHLIVVMLFPFLVLIYCIIHKSYKKISQQSLSRQEGIHKWRHFNWAIYKHWQFNFQFLAFIGYFFTIHVRMAFIIGCQFYSLSWDWMAFWVLFVVPRIHSHMQAYIWEDKGLKVDVGKWQWEQQ